MRILNYLGYTVRYFHEAQTYKKMGINIYEPCLKGVVYKDGDTKMQKPLFGYHYNPYIAEDGGMTFNFEEIDIMMKINVDNYINRNRKIDKSTLNE